MSNVIIDKELEELAFPLSAENLKGLENLILTGKMSVTVFVDKHNVLMGDFNIYKICKNRNIKFSTVQLDVSTRDEAIEWIIRRQFEREDLSMYQRGLLIIKLEKVVRRRLKTTKCLLVDNEGTIYAKPDSLKGKFATNEGLAKIAGISHGTISQIKTIEECVTKEQKLRLLQDTVSIYKMYYEVKMPVNRETTASFISSHSKSGVRDTCNTSMDAKKEIARNQASTALELTSKYGSNIEQDLYNTDREIEYTIDDLSEEISNTIEYFVRNVKDCLDMRSNLLNTQNKASINNLIEDVQQRINSMREEFLK